MNTQPSILLIGNFLSSTVGNRAVCEELAERLAASGWSVFTASSRPGRAARMADMLTAVWRHRHHYAAAHIDIYSGPAFFWAEAAAFALRRLGKPYVLTLHGGDLPEFAHRWPARMRRLFRSAACVTAPSTYLLEAMRPYRDGLRLIPNAIDLPRYPFRLRSRPAPRLVWVRSFHRIYDPSLAVRALALVRRRYPDATLEMVGPDKRDRSLDATRAAAAELGVAGAVQFHGGAPKSEIPTWIDRGDIFLNTTTIDNMPVSLVEAMACGACIVSTRAGGVPHLVRNGAEALLIEPRDPEAMAAAIDRVLSLPALAASLSRSARFKAEQFDWPLILPQWHELLTAVAESRVEEWDDRRLYARP
jgi:glycosyltransferase involved in cell wall biosynthesis